MNLVLVWIIMTYWFSTFLIKFLASSIEFEDDIAYNRHEFSSHTNSVSCPVTKNPILLGQTFQLLERKPNLYTLKLMFLACKYMTEMKRACNQFYLK